MYTLVQLLWLRLPDSAQLSPEKKTITKAYELIQHRILVEDPVLSKAGIPLSKINTKTVRDFIHRQERLVNLHSTKMPSTVLKTTSISSKDLPPAPRQPSVLPPADYPQMEYVHTPSTAGTKALKERMDIAMPVPRTQSQSTPFWPAPSPTLGRRFAGTKQKIPATSTVTGPVSTPKRYTCGFRHFYRHDTGNRAQRNSVRTLLCSGRELPSTRENIKISSRMLEANYHVYRTFPPVHCVANQLRDTKNTRGRPFVPLR